MDKKEKMKNLVMDVLKVIGLLALLCFVCRLWPVLLFMILGIFISALCLLYRTVRDSVGKKEPEKFCMESEEKEKMTSLDLEKMAYSVMLARITELVREDYPDADWVWETPDAKRAALDGREVFILLNGAGGYRRAEVICKNLQVVKLDYLSQDRRETPEEPPVTEPPESEEKNYELLAFQWAQAHMMELNEKCNEAIAGGQSELLIPVEELPDPESWQDICRELERNGLTKVKTGTDGIIIFL